jgi:hypothetical protein
MSNETLNRRSFLMTVVATAAAGALPARAFAEAPGKVTPDDPTAKSLGYVEDAGKIDAAKEPNFKKGSHCGACTLYKSAEAKNGYGPCAIFQGKWVSQNGWCRAYVAKA